MWTALTLGIVTTAGVAAYAAWAASMVAQGVSVWWFAGGLLLAWLALPIAFAALWFAVAWLFRAPRPPERRIGIAATVRMFRDEARAIGRSAPRMALYRVLMRDPAPAPAAAPVLLLHGVLCNAGVWVGLREYLADRGIGPVYALSYGPPLHSIELFADEAAAKIDSMLAATGAQRVAIVAHSMGGLVARAYLRRYGAAKVRCVMTLGAPHHGSAHAWMFPGSCLSQMRPGSAWLAELNRGEAAAAGVRFVSLWSWHDSMVAPQTSSRLAGAQSIELTGVGHNALLADPATFARVAAELGRAAREAGDPGSGKEKAATAPAVAA